MNERAGGFTVVEMLIVMVLGGILLAAVYQTLRTQQQSYAHHSARIDTQRTTRTALAVLQAELREVSAAAGDLTLAHAESVSVRLPRKFAIACSPDAPGQKVDVWNLGPDFETGDSIRVFAEGEPLARSDDAWRIMKLGSIGTVSSGACVDAWPSEPVLRFNLPDDDDKLLDVRQGAPIRAFVRYTYGVYEMGGDGWMLGRHAPDSAAVALVGPVAPPAEHGLAFSYFDASGTELTPPLDAATRATVNRIQVTVRAREPAPAGVASGEYVDSLTTDVYLRNNQ